MSLPYHESQINKELNFTELTLLGLDIHFLHTTNQHHLSSYKYKYSNMSNNILNILAIVQLLIARYKVNLPDDYFFLLFLSIIFYYFSITWVKQQMVVILPSCRQYWKMKHIISIIYQPYQQNMRPKSALNRRKLTNQKKSQSKSKRKQPYNTSYSSVSRVQSRYTSATHKWQIKTEKLKVCKDAKSIALIHAYQPKRLKECIVSDPKSYQRFYNNFGQCQLAHLYTKSFLKHFREWRRNLRQRITNIVSMLSETKEQIKPEQVQLVLQQLQGITQQLKSATGAVLNTKDAQDSKGARELFENFQHMQDYIKKLAQIVRQLCEYIKEINKLLEEGASKSEQESLREIQRKVKKLHKEYERRLIQPLHFCTSHPESTFMNRTQYKMKLKFDHIAKQAIKILEEIFKLTSILQNFQHKFNTYTDSKMRPQQFTVDVLQQIASLISSYEQYKLKDRNILPEQENQITKSNEVLLKLKTKINSEIRLFLDAFREKSYQILQYQLKQLEDERVINSIKNYGNRFKISKKKILTLSKIFNKHSYPTYYELLTTLIKQTSQNFQNVGELIDQLTKMSNNKKIQNRDKVCRVVHSVLPYVVKYEQNKIKICQSMYSLIADGLEDTSGKKKYSLSADVDKQSVSQSQKLKKFLQIMDFSQHQTQQLLSIPHYEVRSPSHIVTNEQIEKMVQSNIQQIYRLSHEVFPNAQKNSIELKKFIHDQLINKFVAFADDIMGESIHCFQIFKEFYSKIYSHQAQFDKKIHKDSIRNMLEYFNETMQKFNPLKNSVVAKRFLQWMFENRMAMYVINNMRKLDKIFNDPLNKQFWSLSEKVKKSSLCYRKNREIKKYIEEKKQLFEQIVISSSKYVRQKSLFDYYFTKSLGQIRQLVEKQEIYEHFDNSVETGEYWPTFKMLSQWQNLQFDYYIDECVSLGDIKERRKRIHQQLVGYLIKISEVAQRVKKGGRFVEECQKKIIGIKQLMQYVKMEVKYEQGALKIKNYQNISKSIMNYLLSNNIYHIGLLAASEQPILFINQKEMQHHQNILEALEKKFRLDPNTLENDSLKSKFIQFSPQKVFKQLMQLFSLKKQDQAEFICQEKTDKKNKIKENKEKQQKKSPVENSNIMEQLLEDLIESENKYGQEVFEEEIQQQDSKQDGVDMAESIIEQTQNIKRIEEKRNSTGAFLLEKPNPPKEENKKQENSSFIIQKQHQDRNIQEYYNVPQSYSPCVYYQIQELTNLNKISQCLKAAKNQSHFISKNVQISKLVLGFERDQPNQQLIDHLNTIISQTSYNNFMTLLNKNNKLTKNQQIFQKLKQALLAFNGQPQSRLVQLRNKKENALIQVFANIGCKFRYLYNQGYQGNRIILCEFVNKDGYVYGILNNPNPLKGQLISDKSAVQMQKLFLNSLLNLPYQKNRNLEQIIEHGKKINQQIKNIYKLLKDEVSIYKKQECKIVNRDQIDKKVEAYYMKKTSNERFISIPSFIDYLSYKLFLAEYQQFSSNNQHNGNKVCKILLNNNQQFPIFISKNQQETKTILQSAILPSRFSGSVFVERNSLEIVNIKYGDILKNILNGQLSGYKKLSPAEVFEMIYGYGDNIGSFSKEREGHIQSLLQKFHKLFVADNDKSNAQDIINVGNLGKVVGVGQYEKVFDKIKYLQGEMQLLEKIASIQIQSASFILPNNEQIYKQGLYLQNVDQCPSFILEQERQKVQIPSYMLMELNELLNKVNMSHWSIFYRNIMVGLSQGDLNAERAIKKCLNTKQGHKIRWKEGKKITQSQKPIQIQQLAIYLTISSRINQNIVKGKEDIAQKVVQSYLMEINNENTIQTITGLNKMRERPVLVQCKYPRRSIEIKLKKKTNSKIIEVGSFITKSYNYGSKYNLLAFQTQIVKDVVEQYEKARIKQQRVRAQQEKRKMEEEQRRKKQEQERLRKIRQEERERQLEQIRKKVLEDQIRKKIQEQQRDERVRKQQQKNRRTRQQQERKIKKAKEQEEQKQKQANKKQKKGTKGKRVIIRNRKKQEQLELYFNFSQDDTRQLPYSRVVWNQNKQYPIPENKRELKNNQKQQVESCESQASEISIVLSQNNPIQRCEIVRKNRCYKFTDVEEIIKKGQAKFILDE